MVASLTASPESRADSEVSLKNLSPQAKQVLTQTTGVQVSGQPAGIPPVNRDQLPPELQPAVPGAWARGCGTRRSDRDGLGFRHRRAAIERGIKVSGDTPSRNRVDRERAITLSVQLNPGYSMGDAVKFFEDKIKASGGGLNYK